MAESSAAIPVDQQAVDAIFNRQDQAPAEKPSPRPAPAPRATAPKASQVSQVRPQAGRRSSISVRPARFSQLGMANGGQQEEGEGGLGVLLDVPLRVTVELGRSRLPVREVLELGPGSVIKLDRSAGDVLDILANGVPIAQGEVVVVGEQFGVRVVRILATAGKQLLEE